MTHIMVDTETTHTNPDDGGIIQLSAIKFNLKTLKVGPYFDRCPSLLPRRYWSESTRAFWRGNKPVLDSIVAREEPAFAVFKDFADFCCNGAPFGGYIFVAKPIKFDWPFVESHFTQLDMPFPFAHSACLDLNSYIQGLRGATSKVDVESEVPFNGSKHNALHDCAYQIDVLFHAKRTHVHAELA